MKVLFPLWYSLVGALFQHLRSCFVAGQFFPALSTCPGSTITFGCTVNGSGTTIWRVNGSSNFCTLAHLSTGNASCGPIEGSHAFTAAPGTGFGTSATSFSSTLSGPALDGTVVECFGPAATLEHENRVGDSTILTVGPPFVPLLSCVHLSKDVSGSVNVTVSWTLIGGGCANFYLISIMTNAPKTPYGGLLNITTASVTQHELTGFMADYEYNITVRGINCGSQEGRESEPLTIRPQVPVVPSSCNIKLLYDQSSGRLLFINSTWNTKPDPVDPGVVCPHPNWDITQYRIIFQSLNMNSAHNVNIARCTAGRCSHTFEPPSNPPSSYDSVSVAAENVVGVGAARTCTTQAISTTNNFLTGEVIGVSSPTDGQLQCTFLSGFTGSAHCTVQYGTDPTYMNLPYSAESTETGTAGDSVSVVLRERLNSSTEYYYTVSAVSGDVTVTVHGKFTTYLYNCMVKDLGNGTQTEIESPMCENSVSSTSIPGGAVCLNGTTVGSTAVYVCSDGYNLMGNESRVCQKDGSWDGSTPQCSPEKQNFMWIIAVIIAVILFVTVVLVLTTVAIAVHKCRTGKGHMWMFAIIVVLLCLTVVGIPIALIGIISDSNTKKGFHLYQSIKAQLRGKSNSSEETLSKSNNNTPTDDRDGGTIVSGGGNTQPKNRIAADYDDTGPKKTQLQTSVLTAPSLPTFPTYQTAPTLLTVPTWMLAIIIILLFLIELFGIPFTITTIIISLQSPAPTWMFATIGALLFLTVLGILISINLYKMEEVSTWMFAIIIFFLVLTVVGIPLAILMIIYVIKRS